MQYKSKLRRIRELLLMLKKKRYEYDWSVQARPEQKIPDSDWSTWCIIAGRGFGKTRTGAEAVREFVKRGYCNIGFIGRSINEIRQIMIEGTSGLLSVYPPDQKPKFYPSLNTIRLSNEAKGYLVSADMPDNIRGYQFDLVWLDEFAKFLYPDECWKQVNMSLRLGKKPRAIITTTPRKIDILERILSKKSTYHTTGTTYANKANLSEDFIKDISEEYEGTHFANQEIYGQITSNSSPWDEGYIQYSNIPEKFDRIVISVDPAVTYNVNSDETGIVIVGKYQNKFYVLGDHSMKAQASVWIKYVANLYKEYKANTIIIEVNQGGSLYSDMFKEYGIFSITEVRAMSNKADRAQLTLILYQKQLVHHVNQFKLLEKQLSNFSWINKNQKSPDRVDALTWALHVLHNMNKAYIVEI